MIDFKGVSIPLISLGIFEVRVSILARSCSDVKRFLLVMRLCCLCAELLVLVLVLLVCGGESSSAPRANTHRPAYVLALWCASVRASVLRLYGPCGEETGSG